MVIVDKKNSREELKSMSKKKFDQNLVQAPKFIYGVNQ